AARDPHRAISLSRLADGVPKWSSPPSSGYATRYAFRRSVSGNTMHRREGLATLAALCAAAPLAAYGQAFQAARRIAYLGSVTTETDKDRLAEFRRELRALGYVEGRNLVIDSRHEVEVARLAPLANGLPRPRDRC